MMGDVGKIIARRLAPALMKFAEQLADVVEAELLHYYQLHRRPADPLTPRVRPPAPALSLPDSDGRKLRQLRVERRLSQEQLSRLSGVPQTTISRMERDRTRVTPRVWAALGGKGKP